MVKQLTQDNFEKEVIESNIPVIIDFYADWCGPCQMMKPVFEKASKEFEGKLKFMKLDTQQEQSLASQFGVQGIPAFSIVKGTQEIERLVGYMTEDNFSGKLNKILKKL